MSSASKTLVINSRERAVSNDIMRLQEFLSADLADYIRYSLLSSSFEGGTTASVPSNDYSGNYVIVNGLLVRPQNAGTAISIDAGLMFVCSPDSPASSDDSPVKMIKFDGMNPLSFGFQSNPSTSDRMDILEFSIDESIVESVSRDIYSPSSGTFAPNTVTKVTKHIPTFRMRQGVAGSGFPGLVNGYYPLAVFRVPHSATNWNGCTIWDVRKLASDIVNASGVVDHVYTKKRYHHGLLATTNAQLTGATASVPGLIGTFTSELDGRRAGGILDQNRVIFPSTTHAEPTFISSFSDDGKPLAWYLYAAFPYGLPRWCQYDPTTMLPCNFNGIAIASRTPPQLLGSPSADLTFPTLSGLTGTVTNATVLISGIATKSGGTMGFVSFYAQKDGNVSQTNASFLSYTTSYSSNERDTTLTLDGTIARNFPEDAIAIKALFSVNPYATNVSKTNAFVQFSIMDSDGYIVTQDTFYTNTTSGSYVSPTYTKVFNVNRRSNHLTTPAYIPVTAHASFAVEGQTISTSADSFTMTGWKSY